MPPATSTTPAPAVPEPAAASARSAVDSSGRPLFYTVKPGDVLGRIALEVGQSWRDLARWNNLDNPNLIEVGQVLRVAPPDVEPARAPSVATPSGPSSAAVARPVGSSPAATGATTPGVVGAGAPAGTGAAAATPSPAPAPGTPALPAAARDPDDDIPWAWPASGGVVAGFEEGRNKGLAIGGRAGDPVLAAADGRVVYAGSGLRGYGNLIIIKHNATYLTAYAHNQTLLVREDQAVRRGQRIAEMGSTEAERVQLHFEIRRQGKPVDPARLLPAR
jgi:lipoprotein NlpD